MGLTGNINRACKDYQGGISTFYVADWVKYSRTQIVTTGQFLTTFPTTTLYKVEAENVTFNETLSIEGGAEKWEQTFSFDKPKTEVSNELYKLLRKDSRVFYIDRIGNIRVLGLYNGLTSENNNSASEKTSLTGFKITLKGLENNQSYYVDDLKIITGFSYFKIKVDATIADLTPIGQFKINSDTPAGGTLYSIKTSDGQDITGLTDDYTVVFPGGSGIYTIEIFPSWNHFSWDANGGASDAVKILEVMNWGDNLWNTLTVTFRGAVNLQITAPDYPLLRETGNKSVGALFSGCTALTGAGANWEWDMSNIKNTESMFDNCVNFNGDISSWDVSNITVMSFMFRFNSVFNQDISNWNVSNVTNMRNMLEETTIFNQDLSSWDVSNVTNMSNMFTRARAFDQDISGWQITQVTAFGSVFMQGCTLSTANYDALLIGWSTQIPLSYSGSMHFGTSKYTGGGAAEAARNILLTQFASITDGGIA